MQSPPQPSEGPPVDTSALIYQPFTDDVTGAIVGLRSKGYTVVVESIHIEKGFARLGLGISVRKRS